MTHYVDVILPLSLPYTYVYSVPEHLLPDIAIGKRVVVQFGSKKYYSAIISRIHHQAPKEYVAKPIEYILDESPCVHEYQIRFWEWLAEYYLAKIGDVMNAALPSGLKIESVSTIQINEDFAIDKEIYDQLHEKEKSIIEILHHQRKIKINELEKLLPKSSIPKYIKSLAEKGIISFLEEIQEKYKPKLISYIELSPEYAKEEALQTLIQQLEKRAFKQLETVLAYIDLKKKHIPTKKQVLIEKSSASALKSLIEKGIFVEYLKEESRITQQDVDKKDIVLTEPQYRVIKEIKELWESKQCCLLYGEVGSGKTEIYIELIKEQIKKNAQVLYLVPEIALTTQLIQRLKKSFGNQVYVYHSRFSENERTEIWNKVLRYEMEYVHPEYQEKCARVVIGPRSALFLPFSHLGLIIIDEEHDQSFRQKQKHPYYNARDAAIYLASILKAKVLLGSATPSVETLYNCDIGKYGKIILKEKYGKAKVSRKLIDIKKYFHEIKHQTLITPPLFEAIKKRLQQKEQVLIFHNRRGYVPFVQCAMCGWVAKCSYCDVSIVYHKQHNLLICHYCGSIHDLISQCPACGSTSIIYKGWGTEKLEEELNRIFPDYRIARLDQDTTRSKFAYKNIIDAFEKQEIDILIGTQMITKGLDFKHVTLVGVLTADAILHFPEFRSFEKAFQLLYQLSGRAGRMDKDGEVLIQSFHPEHPVLQMYLENNYDKFYEYTLKERAIYHYPPYCKIYELIIKNKDENECLNTATMIYQKLRPYFHTNILGPVKPYISKLNNYYLYQILIKVYPSVSYKQIKQIILDNIRPLQSSKSIIDIIIDA